MDQNNDVVMPDPAKGRQSDDRYYVVEALLATNPKRPYYRRVAITALVGWSEVQEKYPTSRTKEGSRPDVMMWRDAEVAMAAYQMLKSKPGQLKLRLVLHIETVTDAVIGW